MRYEVIQDFKDMQDKYKVYKKGDSYPKPANKKISEERIKELSTSKNRQKRPVIQKVEEENEEQE